jgi:HK97 family phage prohead protease
MPYSVVDDAPGCSGWAVTKDGTGEVMGCHRTRAEAEDQLTALNISEFGDERQVDTTPPRYMRRAAARGLELRADGFGGDGLVERTIREARDMAAGRMSEDKVIRANAWGARHAVDLDAPSNSSTDDPGWPGAGAVAHYLWGIDPLNPGPAREWLRRKADAIQAERTAMTEIVNPFAGQRIREVRRASGLEVRRTDNGIVFRGYASVTDHPYDVAGGAADGGWSEIIARGAFKRTLGIAQNRALLVGHDHARVVATTRSGNLTMTEDKVGLLVEARLDDRITWVRDLSMQVESGDLDEMSVGFYARAQSWSKDYATRTVTEVELIEASIVWAGANPATVASVERDMTRTLAEVRGVAAPVVPQHRRAIALAAEAARARLTLS